MCSALARLRAAVRAALAGASSGNVAADEADSLFAKRLEVKDSHDRYGNVEVDRLLHRGKAQAAPAVLVARWRVVFDDAPATGADGPRAARPSSTAR